MGPEMLLIALLGLMVNLIVAVVLGSHHHDEHEVKDVNVESALFHVLGDAGNTYLLRGSAVQAAVELQGIILSLWLTICPKIWCITKSIYSVGEQDKLWKISPA